MARIVGSTGSRRRRTLFALGTVAALALLAIPAISFADNASGCDFSPANNGVEGCSGPLSGSTFAGGDGNLKTSPTTFGTTDWQNVSGLNAGFDLPSGTGDNAFGQGTKEDNANVTVVTGSIPPNKSDLTRFYEASETVSGNTFLYLAWERTNVLGSANMDFEINQKTQPDLTTTGSKALNRTPGDLLITYDFTNGGGKPLLGLNFWLTGAHTPDNSGIGFATNACLSSNSFPCWGDHIDLNSKVGVSIGAVNNLDPVADPLFPTKPNYINPVPALQFGEAAINLTGAGVFPPNTCEAFGSAFLKSRSSPAFTAEVKDFIAPVPVNIANCGEVIIKKHTDPRGINQDFTYTSNLTTSPPSGTTACSLPSPNTATSFTLNDNGNTTGDSAANTQDCKFVPIGSYTVTEGAEPDGYTLESLTCTATGSGSGSQDATNKFQADITLAAGGDTVTCTYTNKAQGALQILKESAKTVNGAHPLVKNAGAVFSYTFNGVTTSVTDNGATDEDSTIGKVCVSGLAPGSYSVTETTAPNGYDKDTSTQSASVVAGTNCGTNKPTTANSAVFIDPPLYDLQVNFKDDGSGETTATISCPALDPADSTTPPLPWDTSKTYTNRHAPATITCTITVDP
jgi:hypothetical protein